MILPGEGWAEAGAAEKTKSETAAIRIGIRKRSITASFRIETQRPGGRALMNS